MEKEKPKCFQGYSRVNSPLHAGPPGRDCFLPQMIPQTVISCFLSRRMRLLFLGSAPSPLCSLISTNSRWFPCSGEADKGPLLSGSLMGEMNRDKPQPGPDFNTRFALTADAKRSWQERVKGQINPTFNLQHFFHHRSQKLRIFHRSRIQEA